MNLGNFSFFGLFYHFSLNFSILILFDYSFFIKWGYFWWKINFWVIFFVENKCKWQSKIAKWFWHLWGGGWQWFQNFFEAIKNQAFSHYWKVILLCAWKLAKWVLQMVGQVKPFVFWSFKGKVWLVLSLLLSLKLTISCTCLY